MFSVGQKVRRVVSSPSLYSDSMKIGHIYTVTKVWEGLDGKINITVAESGGIWHANKFDSLVPGDSTVVAQPQPKIVRYNWQSFE